MKPTPRSFSRLILSLCLCAGLARLQAAGPDDLNLDVRQKKLSNGLTVLVVERAVPVVALAMVMPVGNIDSPPGKTGLPHMLEHMLFKGTTRIGTLSYEKEKPLLDQMDKLEARINLENLQASPSAKKLASLEAAMKELTTRHRKLVVKDELDQIYSRHGGRTLNAWTSNDVTAYTVLLPANQMGVYAALEKERLSHPVFREFYSERDVVMQERRERVDADPQGNLWEIVNSNAFKVHPYHNPTIGWMADIKTLLRPEIEDFYARGYRPDRGVLAMVGGVKAEEVFALLERTVGQVPNPSVKPLDAELPAEPPQTEERRIKASFEADPLGVAAWHQPALPEDDAVALTVLANILGNGNSSRLVKKLVLDHKIAAWVSVYSSGLGERAPDLFATEFAPVPGHSLEEILKAVEKELTDVQRHGVRPEELARARRAVKAGFLWAKDSPEGMAGELAVLQAVCGDWKVMDRYIAKVYEVDSKAVQKAAQRWLVDSNRTVVLQTRPAPSVEDKKEVSR